MNKQYLFIDSEDALQKFCGEVENSAWLAVDTEFEREKTFFPELCLVQVANETTTGIIDPLAMDNLDCLYDLLFRESITKVFHSARQDLEIFFNLHGRVPQPLFDTQLAAPLLGYDDQIGYANLVAQVLGVNLSKAHTRTNWKRRPLQTAQLQYAADDVIYLGEIYTQLLQQLESRGRLSWLEDDFNKLSDPQLYLPDVDKVWTRHRGAKKLRGAKLCALQHLCAWREQRARSQNLPRSWFMKDDLLLNIAQLQPRTESELKDIKGISERLVRKHKDEILRVLNEAQEREPQKPEQEAQRKPLNNKEEAKVDVLYGIVRMIADENHLHPNTLAPRREIEKLVREDPQSLLLKGWRAQMIGESLSEFLAGKSTLQFTQDRLVCEKV